jgi:hypothetical protein
MPGPFKERVSMAALTPVLLVVAGLLTGLAVAAFREQR